MIYVMSDIHGEYDRYRAMLELIGFDDEDRLYIIGDVIDRYPGGIDILRDVMTRPNITMLLGNHEQMCLDDLGLHNRAGARELWRSNGGGTTRREMLYHMSIPEKQRILRFLESLPDHMDVEVGGRQYYLVHGFPSEKPEDRVWDRPKLDTPSPFKDRRTVIIGHTPVVFLTHPDKADRERWLTEAEADRHHMEILHAPGYIDIDCGCGNNTPARRLACLRLDDCKEFYV